MALALLFPSYAISLKKDSIALKKEGTDEECYLNRDNYEEFQQIIKQMFSFNTGEEDDDFRPDGQLASKIAEKLKKRHKKLEELETRDKIYKKVKLNIKPLREGSKIPLKVNNITFGYTEKKLINNLSFNITNNERFLIVGENGVGKSTLLKLIVGVLKPNEGTVWYGSKTDIAYYAQELEILDEEKTIIENVDNGKYNDKELRTSLSNFLFFGDEVFKKVKNCSPGEKARVGLCKIMLMQANFIILDEPTNHLDPETQRIIGENFKKYEGTLIIVSHNPSFVSTIGINRMLILPKGKITNFNEDLLNHYYNINSKL